MIRSLYADFTRTFSNVLFAVLLLLGWGLLTLIGVVIDQGKDPSLYFQSYAAPLARLILRLDFNNIYHTPYYVGMIGLILISLAVCTFKRVIPARLPQLRPLAIDKIPLHAEIDVRSAETPLREAIDTFFKSRGWHIRKREFGGIEWTFADKSNWARRGVLVAHIGFVIIAAGTTVYWARGYSGDVAIATGERVAIPHTQTAIRLDSFSYKIAPIMTKSGMVYQPIDYVSSVTVTGKDGIPRHRTIRVNHPIDVDGTLYYQSTYGFALRLRVKHDGVDVPDLSNRTLAVGESFTIPGTQREVQIAQFIPTVDRQTGQPAPDPRVSNPAVAIAVSDAGQPAGAALVAMRAWIDVGGGWRITPQKYVLVSGLQYRYDPGVALVGIGAFVLLAGLVIAFYFLPARLYVRVDRVAAHTSGDHWKVGLAATTVKGYDIFEHEFRELVSGLSKRFAEAT